MRKTLAVILLTAALALCVHTRANAQAKMTDFSGTWVLDNKKTSDLPPTLESYILTVTQNEQQLTVETELQGEVGVPGGPGEGRSGRGGFPGGPPGGPPPGGFPGGGGGGGGFPGGGPDGGFSMPKDVVMGMALRMAVPKATYTLDGKETVVQTEAREASSGQPAQGGGSSERICVLSTES
jgi:hypothetical protein